MGRGCAQVSVRDTVSARPKFCIAWERMDSDFLILVLATLPDPPSRN